MYSGIREKTDLNNFKIYFQGINNFCYKWGFNCLVIENWS